MNKRLSPQSASQVSKNNFRQFNLTELAREYSPSSCVNDINLYLREYRQLSHQAKQTAMANGLLKADLPYGANADECIDLYLPEHSRRSQAGKLVVYIHGGYWQQLGREDSAFAATNCQQHGCYFAVIGYSLAPKVSLTEIVEQNRRALVWLYQHAEDFGYDGQQIYLVGSSAGAHLAMMLLATDWQQYLTNEVKPYKLQPTAHNLIAGVCAVSGIYELAPIALTYVNDALQLTKQQVADNSPARLNFDYACSGLINKSCPLIIAYGDNETAEFKRQSNEFANKMRALGFEICNREICGRNHFNVIVDLANPDSWLWQQLYLQMQS